MVVAMGPPVRMASSTSSKASAEMSTPAPNAMIPAMILGGTLTHQAIAAPTANAPPAIRPHSPAASQVGIGLLTSGRALRAVQDVVQSFGVFSLAPDVVGGVPLGDVVDHLGTCRTVRGRAGDGSPGDGTES